MFYFYGSNVMLQEIKHKIATELTRIKSEQVIKSFYKNNSLNPSKNIVFTGSPRSGTTWLAEILAKSDGGYMLFEPLSLSGVKRVNDMGFDWRQHIPENSDWPEALEFFKDLNQGKYLTPWMLSHSNRNELLNARFFILKFVRANLLLPWYVQQIKPQRLPIYILRNPLDVVASQLNYDWKNAPNTFTIPNSKYANEYYNPFKEILDKINTTEQFLTARWCLDNVYLIKHPQTHKFWITCIYEQLRNNPEKELAELFSKLNLPFSNSVLTSINEPSKSSYKRENSVDSILDTVQRTECMQIIKAFGLDEFVNETWGL
jgi:hypothetical protein